MPQLKLIRLEAQLQARACAELVEVEAFGGRCTADKAASGGKDSRCSQCRSLYEVSSFHVVED